MSTTPTTRKRKRWPWVVLTIVVVPTTIGLATAVANPPVPATPAPVVAEAPAPAPVEAPPVIVSEGVGDGMYVVGEDMAAGTYQTPGADGMFGAWSVESPSGDIVDLGSSSEASDRQIVTLKDGQTFETDGFQPWTLR